MKRLLRSRIPAYNNGRRLFGRRERLYCTVCGRAVKADKDSR